MTLTPHGPFVSDFDVPGMADLPADFVMGIGTTSQLLARILDHAPVERALDLGTGCGYLAVVMAGHAQQVVATDVNPRALEFARFNALLNAVSNVEYRLGSWFAPVEGETFDRLVTNPPFVISPERSYVFRDGGKVGDALSRSMVQTIPQFLRPGGMASLTINWAHAPQGPWSDPLQGWVRGLPCDAWFLREASYTPEAYAGMWLRRLAHAPHEYAAAMDRWLEYFVELGIEAVGNGAAVLWRRDGVSRVRADELPTDELPYDTGDDLARLLRVEDVLDTLEDDALLAQPLSVPADIRLDQVMRWRAGGFQVSQASLARERGLGQSLEIDPPLAFMLAQIDGTRAVGEVLRLTAAALGAEPEPFRAQRLPVVRQLVEHGFLALPEAPASNER